MTRLLEDAHDSAERAVFVSVFMHPDVTLGDAIKAIVRASSLPIQLCDVPIARSLVILPLPPSTLQTQPEDGERIHPATSSLCQDSDPNQYTLLSQYWLMECIRLNRLVPIEHWLVEAEGGLTEMRIREDSQGHEVEHGFDPTVEEAEPPYEDDHLDIKPILGELEDGTREGDAEDAVSRSRTATPGAFIGARLSVALRSRYRRGSTEETPSHARYTRQGTSPSKRRRLSDREDSSDIKVPVDMITPTMSPVQSPFADVDELDESDDSNDDMRLEEHIPTRVPTNARARKPPKKKQKEKTERMRFVWPAWEDRPVEEKWSMYNYFLDYAQVHLPEEHVEHPDPDDPTYRMDTDTGYRVDAIKVIRDEWKEEIIQIWAEGKRRYTRRNLDHMSVMLSTWKTARRLNIAPSALRDFYDQQKKRIRALAGPYVPVEQRAPGFPWHESEPIDPECRVEWIPDWGQADCAAYMGWDGAGETDLRE